MSKQFHRILRIIIIVSSILSICIIPIKATGNPANYNEHELIGQIVVNTPSYVLNPNTTTAEIGSVAADNLIVQIEAKAKQEIKNNIVESIRRQISPTLQEKISHKDNNVSANSSNDNQSSQNSQTTESTQKPNYVGRFKIPSVGVDVACYASYSQDTVDRRDSAGYFYINGHQTIADHRTQGFDKIKQCVEGTMAILEIDGEFLEYKCVAKITGHNTGTDLTDENHVVINSMYPETLVCYTCNENWRNITIVFFELIDEGV